MFSGFAGAAGTTGLMEVTLALLKPDLVAITPSAHRVLTIIRDNGFFIVRHRRFIVSRRDAAKFYAEHKNKFFYRRLVSSIISGPLSALILARPQAIQAWRDLIGPTKVFMSLPLEKTFFLFFIRSLCVAVYRELKCN